MPLPSVLACVASFGLLTGAESYRLNVIPPRPTPAQTRYMARRGRRMVERVPDISDRYCILVGHRRAHA
jgi:hypothetical protein